MRVAIFGTGYVGLVTGTCLAEVGHQVICVDIDQDKIDRLNRGVVPIYEPGLEPMIASNHAAGRLRFTTAAAEAIARGEIIFIAVEMPPDDDGSADLQYVLAVARTIGRHIDGPAVVVDKSTVPVGTADKVRATIQEELHARGVSHDFEVVCNPAFLKQGNAVTDCMRPDRIIIGARKPAAIARMRRLYAPFNRSRDRIIQTDVRSAELSKYAEYVGADDLVVMTEWKQFRSPDVARLQHALADAVVFDGRNLYDPEEIEAAGLAYHAIGRGRSLHA
ncbi:UDP-glucose dehydrogenase family protein [Xanthomonas maliensis]|uniref:UDP-glucose dehydrogenase family protein n=1 Tax=Xanthomonas maliensis TaxID=1321368 RepID=UPI00039E3F3D|nr:nucleotide sugar dehydrogenase [Xanthomonas maliensis]